MPRSRTHKDAEFAVDDDSGNENIFKTFADACEYAVIRAMMHGKTVHVDVLLHSRAAAKWWGALEEYDEDPDASVSARIAVKADYRGRIA